jgi:hypothetical protein
MNKILTYSIAIASVAALGLVIVPNIVSAQGQNNSNGNGMGYQKMIQTKAELVGMTADELETQLQTKTMLQVAEEKGITEDQLHASMQASAIKRWQDMGLTQSEIDSRVQNMGQHQPADHEANSTNRGTSMNQYRYNQ